MTNSPIEMPNMFNYCFRCGNKFTRKSESILECPKCSFIHYVEPVPATSNILLKDGKIILGRRSKDPNKGKWETPGGFLNIRETFEENTIRELKEELDLDLTKDQIEYFSSYPLYYVLQGINYYVALVIFVVNLTNVQIPKAGDEATELGYFLPNELPLDEMASEAEKKALKDYIVSTKYNK